MTEYADYLVALSKSGIRFVIVGAFGLNLHAERAGPVLYTRECDVMLPPEAEALTCAIRILRGLGFEIEAGGECLPDEDHVVITGSVQQRACVHAASGDIAFDLPLQICFSRPTARSWKTCSYATQAETRRAENWTAAPGYSLTAIAT